MESSHACSGSSTPRGPQTARDSAARGVAFRRFRARRHPGQARFRGSIAGLRAPLSTLRCALTGRQRMTQGHRDSLDLRCRTLSFPSHMPVVRRFPENGASTKRRLLLHLRLSGSLAVAREQVAASPQSEKRSDRRRLLLVASVCLMRRVKRRAIRFLGVAGARACRLSAQAVVNRAG